MKISSAILKSVLCLTCVLSTSPRLALAGERLQLPSKGAFVGAYVDGGRMADVVSEKSIFEFEEKIGKKLVWSYFSDNWLQGKVEFPWENVKACERAGTVPYIRMSPWSEAKTFQTDPWLSMDQLLEGNFDFHFRAWARSAKEFGKPLVVEFGPEVNGDWFPWNGRWNGGATTESYGDPEHPDGPEKFRDVYRRIINIFRRERVTNVTWVFHIDTAVSPDEDWNRAIHYYPGDRFIDWIGLSVFGRQLPGPYWVGFEEKLMRFWSQVEEVSLDKPIVIAEFAVIEDDLKPGRKATWLNEALTSLRTNPVLSSRVKGISYWNSVGFNDSEGGDMRISSSSQAQDAFYKEIQNPYWIGRE